VGKLNDLITDNIKINEKIKAKNLKLFLSRLGRFLDTQIPALTNLEGKDLQGQLAVLAGLQQGLIDQGLEGVVKQIQEAYGDEIRFLKKQFSIVGIEKAFSGADKAVVDELINFDYKKVTRLINPYIDDVASSLMRGVLAGERPNVREILLKSTNVLESQIKTEVDTLLSGFSRAVSANKAKELGLELFVYRGPSDDITRPFCQKVLDRDPAIYTLEEIQELNSAPDAPKGLDVMIYAGGYNCRHQWVAISQERAKELGYGD